MNRLTFFKRLFQGAAAATISTKVEASHGLKITKDIKNGNALDRIDRIEYTPAQIEAFIEKYYLNKQTFVLRGNDLHLLLKRSNHYLNLRRP